MVQTFSRILLHVIFGTKARRNSLYGGMRKDLLAYLAGSRLVRVPASCLGVYFLCLCASAAEDARWCNVALGGTVSASSELGRLRAAFLVDGRRGRQSSGTYWNDGTRWAGPDRVSVQLASVTKVRAIRLAPPVMDISGPFAIKQVSVEIGAEDGWHPVAGGLTLIALRGSRGGRDCIVKLGEAVLAEAVRVSFEDPKGNDEGWNFLGEIEVIGWGIPHGGDAGKEEVMKETVPRTVDAAAAWLRVKAFEMIRACRKEMHDGTAAFPPQVGSGYGAFWLRDYAYMLEGCGEAFTFGELRDAALLFVGAQRADGAMVDTIKFDGTPIYRPGFGRMGEHAVADGSQFAVDVVWHTYRRTGDRDLLAHTVDPLIRGMASVPRSAETGLVHIRPEGWDRCPYGFTDSVRKQGDVLFCSLLYVQACRQLGDLCLALGRKDDASRWHGQEEAMTAAIRDTFWDGGTGLFRAATLKCREPDIWGSAFAVYLGIASSEQSVAIATYFRDHYSEIVKRGQLRHTPGDVWWEQACGREVYQNGAYWATPVGWFVYTLDLVSPRLADQTVVDLVGDFIRLGDVNECINDDYTNVKAYIASAALPRAGIQRMLERRRAR